MRMGREADGLVIDTIDSVGLPGRGIAPTTSTMPDGGKFAGSGKGAVGLRNSLAPCTVRDVVEPLIIASLRRKSSNGAPVVWSILKVLPERGVPMPGDLTDKSECDLRVEIERDAFKKTVCGTTPSFCSSIAVVDFREFVSISALIRFAKLGRYECLLNGMQHEIYLEILRASFNI